jgi:hypothetical protein
MYVPHFDVLILHMHSNGPDMNSTSANRQSVPNMRLCLLTRRCLEHLASTTKPCHSVLQNHY